MKRESRNEIEKEREHDELGTHKYYNCPEVGGGKLTVIDWHRTLSDPLDEKNISEFEYDRRVFVQYISYGTQDRHDICIKIKQTFYY